MTKRILAIEDDAAQQRLIQRALEKRNYQVLTAISGEEGLALAQSEKPDVILLDVILPGIKGNEICRQLKSNALTKKIPVIFLTSMNSPHDVMEQYELGGEVHLAKPVNPKELIQQIEITLEEQAQIGE